MKKAKHGVMLFNGGTLLNIYLIERQLVGGGAYGTIIQYGNAHAYIFSTNHLNHHIMQSAVVQAESA